MTPRKNVLLIAILIIIGVAAFVFTRTRQNPTPQQIPDVSRTQSLGVSPNYSDISLSPVFFLPENLNIPETLQEYTVSFDSNINSSLQELAGLLLINSPPKENFGLVEWNNDDFFLSYNPRDQSVAITRLNMFSELLQNQNELFDLLSRSGFLSSNIAFKETLNTTLRDVDGGIGPLAVQLFSAQIDSYPLFFSLSESAWLTLRKTPQGAVDTVSFLVPPNRATKENEKKTFSQTQIQELLNSGKGTLFSANFQKNKEFGTQPNFSTVNISSVSVAYLLSENKTLAKPIFVLQGIGTGTARAQEVVYLLPATN